MKLHPNDDAHYPRRLWHLDEPPELTVSGPLEADRTIAVVGSREAILESRSLAFGLGYHLARAGITVVSGGAVGVDALAHTGAIAGGGATWVVACTGRGACFPTKHDELFAEIEASPTSRMIWPFPDGAAKTRATPRLRNRVLVALSERVVVIQAKYSSGSMNAANEASQLGRPLHVVPGTPGDFAFNGSTLLLAKGALPLWGIGQLFADLGLPAPDLDDPRSLIGGMRPQRLPTAAKKQTGSRHARIPSGAIDTSGWTDPEILVFSKLSGGPTQQDKIIAQTGLGASSTLTALLTLSLKDVVVEGPDGFFRRRFWR